MERCYQKDDLRISVLTPRLLRVEKGNFTDLPTQTVLNRELGEVDCRFEERPAAVCVTTGEAIFRVKRPSGKVLQVELIEEGITVTDFTRGNLLGTARTLDQANGAVRLQKGIMSRSGVAVMDDSKSLLLNQGQVLPRKACSDRYYFAYGSQYQRALQDFFRLSGQVPLIPKFALGNWWSRYKAYTQEEYRELMQTFIRREIPITVATIDMDWHWTDVMERFGEDAKPGKAKCLMEHLYNRLLPGWTGYTWNTELFPDHRELLSWLHRQNFRVTLNVHPSQGVRFFEKPYGAVCNQLGLDPEKKECVGFDIADPGFRKAYFEELHHPLEKEGVDFWWLDWQQGKKTAVPGLDPLWALNHYHSLDAEKDGRRGIILSRYAGLGSHRYPLGFSGDTHCTWKSLAFQPYFTNTAANAGYTWWSHDIGGHMLGIQDDELYVRWLQYGVFSPINRLHSSNSDYMGKEPWKRSWAACAIAEGFLRLRHQLIPYLYTANWKTHKEGIPICMPMYYRWDCEDAYRAKNQYIFGGQLLVCPITEPADPRLNLAKVDVWLPEGRWTDIFNGRIYRGGGWVTMYRDLDSIPVLAPAGAMVPMYREGRSNDLSLEQPLQIHIWRGSGEYTLYEDDGETTAFRDGEYALTRFSLEETEKGLRLTVTPPEDSHGLLPAEREIQLVLRDVEGEDIRIRVGQEPIVVELEDIRPMENEPTAQLRSALLTRVQAGNRWKSSRFQKRLPRFVEAALEELDALE